MGICRDIIMINTGTISDENMTSDAWDKVKEREKKKKEGGREKKYLISMAVFIAFCSLGSIATFSKSTKDANENDNIQNEEMKQENLETDDDEGWTQIMNILMKKIAMTMIMMTGKKHILEKKF